MSEDTKIKSKLRNNFKNCDAIFGPLSINDICPTEVCKLPSKKDVLMYLIYLKRNSEAITPERVNENIVLNKVKSIWDISGIATQDIEKNPAPRRKLKKLFSDYLGIRKKVGNKEKFIIMKDKFLIELDGLFDIAANNAIDIIKADRLRSKEKIQEDIDFLKDQRESRKMTIGQLDKVYNKKVVNKISKMEKNKQRLMNESIRKKNACKEIENEEDSDEVQASTSTDPDYVFGARKLKKRKLNLLESPALNDTADRLGLSIRKRTLFAGVVAKKCGINLEEIDLSKSSTARCVKSSRNKTWHAVKNNFIPPSHVVLHIDTKRVINNLGEKEERLAIVISGKDFEKLLEVPSIEDGSGLEQAQNTYDVLDNWNLIENVFGMVFDTTSANTGWKNGACTILENLLSKKLLWFACRHHVLEIILSSVYRIIFGKDTISPNNEFFKKFKEITWKNINLELAHNILEVRERELRDEKNSTIETLKNIEQNNMPRDDYRELIESTLLISGEIPARGIHWIKPGAIHHARWMAIVLYTNKMFAFSNQAEFDSETTKKLERFCKFTSLFYAKYWMTCTEAGNAPIIDLNFYNAMVSYKKHDHDVAQAALDALKRHYWYLTEELSVLSLFGSCSDEDKGRVAKELIKYKKPQEFKKGHPIFPVLKKGTTINRLVGPQSWYIFEIMNCAGEWLTKPISEWEHDKEYVNMKEIISSTNVVNDSAERYIKLMSDFHSFCRDEKQYQNVLHVVEKNRKEIPDDRKKSIINFTV